MPGPFGSPAFAKLTQMGVRNPLERDNAILRGTFELPGICLYFVRGSHGAVGEQREREQKTVDHIGISIRYGTIWNVA